MEEQLERGIDLNRTKVRSLRSCWSTGCSSPHLWWRRLGVIKTRQEVKTQVPEAGEHFHNLLTAMQESGDVTAPPEIHNHLPDLLNFKWLIILFIQIYGDGLKKWH